MIAPRQPGDAHHVAADAAVFEEELHGARQVRVDGAATRTRQRQVAAEYPTVLVEILHDYRQVEWAALGEADEAGDIQPQRAVLVAWRLYLTQDTRQPWGVGQSRNHRGPSPYSISSASTESTSSSIATSLPPVALKEGAV